MSSGGGGLTEQNEKKCTHRFLLDPLPRRKLYANESAASDNRIVPAVVGSNFSITVFHLLIDRLLKGVSFGGGGVKINENVVFSYNV